MSKRFRTGMYALTPEGLLDSLEFIGTPISQTPVLRLRSNLGKGEWVVVIWRDKGEPQFSAYNLLRYVAPLSPAEKLLKDVKPDFTTTDYDALITATKLLAKE